MSDTTNTGAPAADGTEGTEQTAAGQETQTFTQQDLDRIVAERIARERKRYADYEDLKAAKARLDEMEEASASDVEKAVKKARDEVAAELRSKHIAERVTDKIEVAAAGKFADVEDARLRLAKRADEFVDEDGNIDTDGIAKAVDELLEKHPHLRAAGAQQTPARERAGLGVTGGRSPSSPAEMFAAVAQQALGDR